MLWSGLLLLLLGVPIAWLLSLPAWRGQTLLEILVTLPLVFPPIAIGFFLLLLLGRDGWFSQMVPDTWQIELIFTFEALLIAAVIAGLPLVVKPIQTAWQQETRHLVEAAYCLGKTPLQTFFHITLPSILPALLAGLALGMGRGLGEVGMSLLLGGNLIGQTDTLSLAIYNSVLDGNFDCAMGYSVLLAAVAITLFLVLRYLARSPARS